MPVPLGIGGLLEDTGEVNMKLVLQGKCRTLFDFRAGEVGDSGMKLQAKMTMTAAGEDGLYLGNAIYHGWNYGKDEGVNWKVLIPLEQVIHISLSFHIHLPLLIEEELLVAALVMSFLVLPSNCSC